MGLSSAERERFEPWRATAPDVPAIVGQAVMSPGSPLDGAVRRPMETRLGHDFGEVRVHRGPEAAAAAAAVGARAYTVGRDIVFGAGQYAPQTPVGRALLAHELAHTVQQPAWAPGAKPLRLGPGGDEHERQAQRWSRASLSPGGGRSLAPVPSLEHPLIQRQSLTESVIALLPDEYQQPLRDLRDSVTQSPQYFLEFFTEDLLKTIEENWPQILAVTLAFLAAEEIIAILAAAPTGVSQLIAAILQIIVLAVLGAFALVETVAAVQQGMRWISQAREANGNPAKVADASRAFVRMIWHILMAVIALAGVRAKVKGLQTTAASGAAEAGGGGAGVGGARAAGGEAGAGNVVELASRPGFRPSMRPGAPSAGPTASHVEGTSALKVAPEPVVPTPEPLPVRPAPAPVQAAKPVPKLPPARATAAATGAAVGVETARPAQGEEEKKRRPTMRHQVQRGDDHLASASVTAADPARGVTARELRDCMSRSFDQYMALAGSRKPRRPVEYERPIRSGIIWQSQQLPGLVAAGGVTQGGDINALRWCFGDRTLVEVDCDRRLGEERVRLDVENNGHNLRFNA